MNRASAGSNKPRVSETIKPQNPSAKITARMTFAIHRLLSSEGEETEFIFSSIPSLTQTTVPHFSRRLGASQAA